MPPPASAGLSSTHESRQFARRRHGGPAPSQSPSGREATQHAAAMLALTTAAQRMDTDYDETCARLDTDMLKQDSTGWWSRTRWHDHLRGRDLRFLARLGRLPRKDEVTLVMAVEIFDMWAEQALAGVSTLDQEARRWLRSEKRGEISPRPFARLQNLESEDRYLGYFCRFLCYLVRVYQAAAEDLDDPTTPGRHLANVESEGESESEGEGESESESESKSESESDIDNNDHKEDNKQDHNEENRQDHNGGNKRNHKEGNKRPPARDYPS